jgi:hypothetical protein
MDRATSRTGNGRARLVPGGRAINNALKTRYFVENAQE